MGVDNLAVALRKEGLLAVGSIRPPNVYAKRSANRVAERLMNAGHILLMEFA
jgi:hypothetical protein